MSRRQTKAEKRERWARQQAGRSPSLRVRRRAGEPWWIEFDRPGRVEWRPGHPAPPPKLSTLALMCGALKCWCCGADDDPTFAVLSKPSGDEVWCKDCAPELFAQAREAMR